MYDIDNTIFFICIPVLCMPLSQEVDVYNI